MRIHEQIYTSAARLLEGGGNLGIVAESRGFPRLVGASLGALRAYTMLPKYSLADPGAHPPRLVVGPINDGKLYALTSTVFAGADHTGRTTPLTHHIIFATDDARQNGFRPSELLPWAASTFALSWSDEPRWIDPPRDIARSELRSTSSNCEPLKNFTTVLPVLIDTVLGFNRSRKAAVLVVDPGESRQIPLSLSNTLELLPPSLQWSITCATHVVSVNDFVREAALLVTYPDSPFLEQCRMRRDPRAPLIFDLTGEPPSIKGQLGSWGAMVARDNSSQRTSARALQFDQLQLGAEDIDRFAEVATLADELRSAPTQATSDEWRTFSARVQVKTTPASLTALIEHAAVTALSTLAKDEQSASRWTTLSIVAMDERWPESVRRLALERLFGGGDGSIDTFVESAPIDSPAFKDVLPLATSILTRRPDLTKDAVARALSTSAAGDIRRATAMLAMSQLSGDAARELALQILSAPPSASRSLQAPLFRLVASTLSQPADIDRWTEWAANNHIGQQVERILLLPLLQNTLERTNTVAWREWLAKYATVAGSSNAVREASDWVCRTYGRQGQQQQADINAWLNCLTDAQRCIAQEVVENHGLGAPRGSPAPYGQASSFPPSSEREQRNDASQRTHPRPPVTIERVGPLRRSRYMAYLLLVATVALATLKCARVPPLDHATWMLCLTPGAAAISIWCLFEMILRRVIRSPDQLVYARMARWCSLLFLVAGLAVSGWLLYKPMRSFLLACSAYVTHHGHGVDAKQ